MYKFFGCNGHRFSGENEQVLALYKILDYNKHKFNEENELVNLGFTQDSLL